MGRPKAWLPFAGECLLQRVTRIVRQVVDPVIVVAAPGQDIPKLPAEVLVVRDEFEGRGPLQGLATGMKALEGRVDRVYLSSCDAPLLRPQFVERVISLFRPEMTVPLIKGRYHPLAAVYRTSILPYIQLLLAGDRLQLVQLFDQLPKRTIQRHELVDIDPEFESLRNVNTPDEYRAALVAYGLARE